MKRTILFTLFFLTLPIIVVAQDKPQSKSFGGASASIDDKGKVEVKPAADPPAEAVIDPKAAEAVQRAADNAERAALRAENLGLKIAQAQAELQKLIDEMNKSRDESAAVFARAAIKAGIPGEKVGEYAREIQKDGSIKLTRKQSPPK